MGSGKLKAGNRERSQKVQKVEAKLGQRAEALGLECTRKQKSDAVEKNRRKKKIAKGARIRNIEGRHNGRRGVRNQEPGTNSLTNSSKYTSRACDKNL